MGRARWIVGVTGAVLICASGCAMTGSSTVSQDEVYTSYTGSYDESTGVLRWSSSFNIAGPTGTYLELDPPSQVSFDGRELASEVSFINTVDYGEELRGVDATDVEVLESHRWDYENNDEQTFSNLFSLPARIDFAPNQVATLSLGQGFQVGWQTADSANSEDQIIATVQSMASGGGSSSSVVPSPSGSAGTISFAADLLQSIQPGAARLQLCRSRTGFPSQAPAAGGSYSLTYCSRTLAVTVNP